MNRELTDRPSHAQRKLWSGIVKWCAAAGLLSAGAYFLAPAIVQRIPGLARSEQPTVTLTHTVRPDSMLITVTEDGNVESARNVDVKCGVAGGSTILWLVADGQEVEQDEVIVRLNPAPIEDQLTVQEKAYGDALATKIQAEQDYKAAGIAVEEYAEGTFVKELQDFEAQITIAMENLRSAENILEHTEKMARRGFVTELQLESDQFAVKRADLDLKSAQTAKMTLEKFTRNKTMTGLEAIRETAKAKLESAEAAYKLEEVRLERLREQLVNCVIRAPQRGMVVYANDRSRRSTQQTQIEEGASVRETQTILQLPELERMQVKVTVHESKVDQIRVGMPCRITIQDRELTGAVVSIGNQPEPGSWYSTNVKEYATVVSIDTETQGLKPGMTAEVEILVAELTDVLTVPVSAVVEQRGKFLAWVQKPNGPERRLLLLGLTNDKVIEIKDGLADGDEVLLNPRAVVPEAREPAPENGDQRKAFGNGSVPAANGKSNGKAGKKPKTSA